MEDRLKDYAGKSAIMEIKISYGGEVFKFNLSRELRIDERTINRELQEQPSSYAFLSLLHKKLYRKMKDTEQELNKIYARLYSKYLEEGKPEYGRGPTKEALEQRVTKNKDYQKSLTEYLNAEEDAKVLETCVRAFEQRKDIIQTLSANIRKEV